MIELPDPKSPPSKMDMLVFGPDCCRHPLLGCIIGHGNGTPEEQARSFLLSLRNATIHKVAGRAGDLSEDEFRTKWRALLEWEKTNSVQMPKPIVGHPMALGHDAERDRQAHMAEQYRIDRERQQAAAQQAAQKLRDAEAALIERHGKPVH